MVAIEEERYEIREEIGRGGFASVYRAYDRVLDRYVALKVLSGTIANDTEFMARFEREARVAARLDHPNIVTIHDYGRFADGRAFIAMRLLEGRGLERILETEAPLGRERITAILKQVASALDYTHERGTIHRDVKPSNVIVSDAGTTTLTDFGIARAFDSARVTLTGAAIGTPRYMAPEQIRGEAVTSAADVYALGVVTFEMLAGQPPFEGDGTALMYKIVHETPPSITLLNPNLPPAVGEVISRALEKEPEQRWPSAGALVGALEDAFLGALDASIEQTIVAPPPNIADSEPATAVPLPGTEDNRLDRTAAGLPNAEIQQPERTTTSPPGVQDGQPDWTATPSLPNTEIQQRQEVPEPITPTLRPHVPTDAGASPMATGAAQSPPPDESAEQQAPPPEPDPAAPSGGPPRGLGTRNRLMAVIGGGAVALLASGAAAIFILGGDDDADRVAEATNGMDASYTQTAEAGTEADDQYNAATMTAQAPTATPSATPTPQATPTPTGMWSEITDITLEPDGRYAVEFQVGNYELSGSIQDQHVHFFFDTVPEAQAGVPGRGPWIAYGGTSPFREYRQAQRSSATEMCILVANPDHSIIEGTGNCVRLP